MPYTHKCAHTCVCVCVSVFVCVCIILSVIAAAVVRGEWWREGGVVTYPRVTCRRSRSVPIPINDIYLIPMNNIETIYIPVVAGSYHACNIHVDIQYIPTLQHPRFFFWRYSRYSNRDLYCSKCGSWDIYRLSEFASFMAILASENGDGL